MAHTFSCLHYHLVFSTLGRRNLIPQDFLDRLHGYVAGIAHNIGARNVVVGGTANHLHVVLSLPPDVAVSKATNVIKSNSSKWAHATFPAMAGFSWQEGYGAFAVSKSNVPDVARYIRDQPGRHRSISFEEEILALVENSGIECDRQRLFG